ncbi:MAG: carbohydrate porin [Rhodocyclales bacterium]|nr:carbohydrate porin [Rhodocyclales bacterium]
MTARHRSFLAGMACLLATVSVQAEDNAQPNFAEDTLTGDWGGDRTAAAKRGFSFEGGVKVDALRNRGALGNGHKTASHIDLKLKMDLAKAAGWSGGTSMINVISDSGWGPNARHAGGQMGVTNIEVAAPGTTRLFQAWLQQSFFDDKLVVLAGLYPIDSEFFGINSAGVFLGPQYGTPADLALTTSPSIFNNSAFGFRARWTLAPSFYAMGAVLDGVPNDPVRPKRTAIRFARGDGSFTIGEFGWLPEASNDKFRGHAKLALGLWGYSAKANDLVDVDAAGNPMRRSRRGGYLLGERTLVRLGGNNDRFLTGFARYTFADGDSSAIGNSLNLGVHARSLFASRPDDILGLAWTRAGLADKWRRAQTVATASNETALEVTYRYAVTPWFAVQPNYQHIRNPSLTPGTPNARLIGVRLEFAL